MIGFVFSWLQYFMVVMWTLLYPLYRSLRALKKKGNPNHLQIMLKYWVIYAILYFVGVYFRILIDSFITFYSLLEFILSIVLIVDNFRVSVGIYDNVIHQFFTFNEPVIDNYLKIMNDNISDSREKAVKNGRSYASNFIRETLMPLISRFMFQNPQEPENVTPQKNENPRGTNTANPSDAYD